MHSPPRAPRARSLVAFGLVLVLAAGEAGAMPLRDLGKQCAPSADPQYDCGRAGLTCVNRTCSPCARDADCDYGFVCKLDDAYAPPPGARLCKRYRMFESMRVGDVLATAFTFLGAMLAAGGGIGGGGLFVPLFMLLIGLTPYEAVPLSQAMIFGGGLVNFYLNVRESHPLRAERPLINYEAVIMLEPLMLAGTVLGVLANTIFPSWLIVVLLVVMLSYASYRTFLRGVAKWRSERAWQEMAASGGAPSPSQYTPVGGSSATGRGSHPSAELASYPSRSGREHLLPEDGCYSATTPTGEVPSPSHPLDDGSPPLLRGGSGRAAAVQPEPARPVADGAHAGPLTSAASSADEAPQGAHAVRPAAGPRPPGGEGRASSRRQKALEELLALDRQHAAPLAWVACILLLLLVTSLLRGGRAGAESVVGVKSCSAASWLLLGLTMGCMAAITLVYGRVLRARHRRRELAGYEFADGDVHWTWRNTIAYPLLATAAGAAGGLLGIGGGMIIGPLLLELGLLPTVTSATSALTVLVTAAAGTLQFLILDLLLVERAAWYFAVGMAATYLGQTCVNALVRRYNSTAIIIFAIVVVMACATLLMAIVGVLSTIDDIKDGRPVGFHDPC